MAFIIRFCSAAKSTPMDPAWRFLPQALWPAFARNAPFSYLGKTILQCLPGVLQRVLKRFEVDVAGKSFAGPKRTCFICGYLERSASPPLQPPRKFRSG